MTEILGFSCFECPKKAFSLHIIFHTNSAAKIFCEKSYFIFFWRNFFVRLRILGKIVGYGWGLLRKKIRHKKFDRFKKKNHEFCHLKMHLKKKLQNLLKKTWTVLYFSIVLFQKTKIFIKWLRTIHKQSGHFFVMPLPPPLWQSLTPPPLTVATSFRDSPKSIFMKIFFCKRTIENF